MNTNLGLDQDLINSVKNIVEACGTKEMEKEELHPNQKVLDKNKNGKLDADDFKKLRKEEAEFTIEDYDLDELEEFMVSEEFQELDEVSGKLLGNYIQKARADASAKYAHGKELDAHPKVKKISDKLSDYYSRREYTKTGASKYRKQIDKAHDDISDTKKKLDPNYPKSVSGGKRLRGVEKAVNKLTHGKLTNEQMEEIETLAAKHGLGE